MFNYKKALMITLIGTVIWRHFTECFISFLYWDDVTIFQPWKREQFNELNVGGSWQKRRKNKKKTNW